MSKDPAMLWYWSDWNSGTVTMSRFLKGCYIDVLHAQFNSGPLSLEEIKTVLGADFGQAWPVIQKKFMKTKDGLFFNARLKLEKEKRQAFIESRSGRKGITKDKIKSRDDSNEKSYEIHTVNRNKNENKDLSFGESENLLPVKPYNPQIPTLEEFMKHCEEKLRNRFEPLKHALEMKYHAWVEAGWKDGNDAEIGNKWKSKILHAVPFLNPEKNAKTQSNKTRSTSKVNNNGSWD